MITGSIKRNGMGGAVLLVATLATIGCGDQKVQEPTKVSVSGAPGTIELDATYVYWTATASKESGGAVWRMKLDGKDGDEEEHVADQPWPFDLQIWDGYLYWTGQGTGTTDGEVTRAPIAGGAVQQLATSLLRPSALVFGMFNDQKVLYWTDLLSASQGRLKRLAIGADGLASGQPEVVATMQGLPEGIAAGVGNVYWTDVDAGKVLWLPEGGALTELAAGQERPRGILANEVDVYWTTAGADAGPDGMVMHVVPGVMAANPIATEQNVGGLGRPALDTTLGYIYWLNVDGSDHTLMRAPKAGGEAEEVTTPQPGATVTDLAVDAKRVYWLAGDGSQATLYYVDK